MLDYLYFSDKQKEDQFMQEKGGPIEIITKSQSITSNWINEGLDLPKIASKKRVKRIKKTKQN